MSTTANVHSTPLLHESFIELPARERARSLLDAGSFRELLGPFDRIESPWLPLQGIVCQADDGCVIARGTIDGEPAVVAAIESAFQGGSIGEVSGSKIAAALEMALRDCERGKLVRPVVLFETGGVRLQEANLGLAVIAEIQAAIVALRRHVPVVGVIARGTIDGEPAVVAAIESAFQGGSIGEVSGSKIAAALELALRDCERGKPVRPVVLFETGGVRLQEANLGLAVIAEIQAAIVALRRHVPVVGVISGMVGCFGGMSLAAALCSYLVVTKQGRLGMNGPEVIEQEAGIDELDSSDRRHVWQLIGGEQRALTGFADALVEDDPDALRTAVRRAFAQGVPAAHRTEQVDTYLDGLAQMDPANVTPETMRAVFHPTAANLSSKEEA